MDDNPNSIIFGMTQANDDSTDNNNSPPKTPQSPGRHTPPPLPGRPPNARMETTGITPQKNGVAPFDIVATYKRLLAEDTELTMPVAAIEALVLALAHTPASTVSETLDLLSTLTAELKRGVANPISLSAGTDLFQRYIITTLQRPNTQLSNGSRPGSSAGFDDIRTHLVRNGRLFVERAKEARDKIASYGKHFIRDGHTILTNGGSRVVGALLRSAAESSGGFGASGSIRFKVIYVVNESEQDGESMENVLALRQLGVPVATILPTAVAYSLNLVTAFFVGAEGVVESGGVVSRLGTYQLAMLAKMAGKPFYVVAESHKFVRLYPLGQADLGIDQQIVDFVSTEGKVAEKEDGGSKTDGMDVGTPKMANNSVDAVDFTPPHLISGILTESGVLMPSAVSEELIKIWF